MIKSILAVLLLVSGLQTSWAFSLAGPVGNGGDGWQVTEIGYGPPSDDVAPKNLGEEYRRNTPVMYYAFDANFMDPSYFGPVAATSVDAAYAMLNALTNVDKYSKQLSEFPLESRNINYQAQALGLYDLKSFTLGIMMEQLGLADPVQYTWTLHDRFHVGPIPCPVGMEYLVAQRNFDYFASPLNQLQYSPYVNATLYSYQIIEICAPGPVLALAVPFSVDPLADIYSPVSCAAITWGEYYTSLTRDDVAGLRYLLSTNNINWETPAADSLSIVTNKLQELFPVSIITNSGVLFNGTFYGTASYGALLSFSKTNNLAAVQAAFPGVQATLVANYFTNVIITNTISYFTNYYTEPIGTPPHLITKKVPTPTIIEYFSYSFDNIITNIYSNKTISKLQTITVAPMNGAPIGSPLATNVVTKNVTTSVPSGEFYILPTNSPCGVSIISALVTFTNYTTNVLTASVGTNATSTNTGNSYSQILITPSISHVYNIHPVTCGVSNAITGLYRGIGNIKFVRADYDSLLGQNWRPVTNDYSMVLINSNSQAVTQYFRRVVTTPDFLFSALDLTTGPPDPVHGNFVYQSSVPGFDTANVLPGLAGPGTIAPTTTISFNKAGPIYFNSFGDVMDGTPFFNQTPGGDVNDAYFAEYFVWASFDGSTNAPIVYPNGTSLDNLQNQILVQISPTSLPDGRVDFDYYNDHGVTFTATGGAFTQPFTWSSPNLPEGLILSPDGKLSGGAAQAGTYDFIVRLTDQLGRSVEWTYTITINPT